MTTARARLGRRPAALAIGVVGAGLALLALTATWARLGPGTAPGSTLTGREAAPAAFALSLAALAGTGVLMLVGRGGRRVVGALLVLLGAGMVVAGVVGARGVSDGSSWPDAWSSSGLPVATGAGWAVPVVVGGLLVGAAGLLAVVLGRTWADTASRYSAGGRPADTDAWRALDQGVDPTLGD